MQLQPSSPDHGWPLRVLELARRRIQSPHDFLDWAKRDRHWSFTLAEVMRESCTNPTELAARLLLAIVQELEEEREILRQDLEALDGTGTGADTPAEAPAYAE